VSDVGWASLASPIKARVLPPGPLSAPRPPLQRPQRPQLLLLFAVMAMFCAGSVAAQEYRFLYTSGTFGVGVPGLPIAYANNMDVAFVLYASGRGGMEVREPGRCTERP
jgi:hypothetical protein